MPLFFALSGYILNKFGVSSSFTKFLLKRSKTILWPFILFRTFLFIYWVVIESRFRSLDLGPIWFLAVLYFAELTAYPFFYNKNHKGDKQSKIVIGAWLVIVVLWFELKMVLPVDYLASWLLRGIDGLMWYILGYVCGIVERSIKPIMLGVRSKLLLVGGLLTISIVTGALNPRVSMWSNSYGENYLLYIFGGIVGSIWLAFICRWFISSNTFLEHLGQNTITVLAVHEPIKRIVLKMTEMVMRSFGMDITASVIQESTLYSLTIVAIIIASSWGVVNVLKSIKGHMPMYVRTNLMAFIK